MPTTFMDFVGDGITELYAIPFSYLQESDVKVTDPSTGESIPFTLSSLGTQVRITSPADYTNKTIRIQRETDLTERLTDYANGAVLTENALDNDSLQAFNRLQELGERGIPASVGPPGDAGQAGSQILSIEGEPTDDVGRPGDYALDTLSNTLFGPKTETWAGVNNVTLSGNPKGGLIRRRVFGPGTVLTDSPFDPRASHYRVVSIGGGGGIPEKTAPATNQINIFPGSGSGSVIDYYGPITSGTFNVTTGRGGLGAAGEDSVFSTGNTTAVVNLIAGGGGVGTWSPDVFDENLSLLQRGVGGVPVVAGAGTIDGTYLATAGNSPQFSAEEITSSNGAVNLPSIIPSGGTSPYGVYQIYERNGGDPDTGFVFATSEKQNYGAGLAYSFADSVDPFIPNSRGGDGLVILEEYYGGALSEAQTIGEIPDVSVVSPEDGQVLMFEGGQWSNQRPMLEPIAGGSRTFINNETIGETKTYGGSLSVNTGAPLRAYFSFSTPPPDAFYMVAASASGNNPNYTHAVYISQKSQGGFTLNVFPAFQEDVEALDFIVFKANT